MGKIALFERPTFDPADPTFPWFPTDRELRFGEITDQIDNSTREKVAVLASVLGMTHLSKLCVDCALTEIIKLCERPDVNAVLTAYQQDVATARDAAASKRGAI
jgi:hypothetical protein